MIVKSASSSFLMVNDLSKDNKPYLNLLMSLSFCSFLTILTLMKYAYLLLFFVLIGCTLSADQETALNDAMTAYTSARNNGEVMTYVAYTYPDVVAYYKDEGDSSFIKKFGGEDLDYLPYIQDGNLRDVEFNGSKIHVKYQFLEIQDALFEIDSREIIIFAISEDDGKNWYFMDELDYMNEAVFSQERRLIK